MITGQIIVKREQTRMIKSIFSLPAKDKLLQKTMFFKKSPDNFENFIAI